MLYHISEAAIPTITMVNDDIDFNTVRYASVHTQTEESTDDNTEYVEGWKKEINSS